MEETRRRERSRVRMELLRGVEFEPKLMKKFRMVAHSELEAAMVLWKEPYETKKKRKTEKQAGGGMQEAGDL